MKNFHHNLIDFCVKNEISSENPQPKAKANDKCQHRKRYERFHPPLMHNYQTMGDYTIHRNKKYLNTKKCCAKQDDCDIKCDAFFSVTIKSEYKYR
ncbi:MAG: hypothetical protein EOM59_04150 [Clostridia bacterium]|nr:hypothetical protein [Clostridia bacterium]